MKGSWRVELLEEAGARPAEATARVCQEERLLDVEETVAFGCEGSAQVHLVLDQRHQHGEHQKPAGNLKKQRHRPTSQALVSGVVRADRRLQTIREDRSPRIEGNEEPRSGRHFHAGGADHAGVAVGNLYRNATFGVRPVFRPGKPLRPDGGVTA